MLDPNPETHARALRLMRSAWSCTLIYDQNPHDTQCMIDPNTGNLIIAIVKDALDAVDITLACPRDSLDTRIRIAVDLHEPASPEQCDRFTTYHLPTTTPLLAAGRYEYAKLDSGEVVTPDQCPLSNPLAGIMGPLCNMLNSDRTRLARLCMNLAGRVHENPLVVGVDPEGIDVRASFGLVRLSLPTPIPETENAMDAIESILGPHDA